MKSIGIIYGSTTGTCQSIAEMIAAKLSIPSDNVHDIYTVLPQQISQYDVLFLGSSTWGDGELQDDWYDGINKLKSAGLQGKIVALFGCGDSESYCDTFCDAIADIYTEIKGEGCTIVGATSTEGYSYSDSKSVADGQFIGLAIDEINQSDKTSERIDSWVASIKPYL